MIRSNSDPYDKPVSSNPELYYKEYYFKDVAANKEAEISGGDRQKLVFCLEWKGIVVFTEVKFCK